MPQRALIAVDLSDRAVRAIQCFTGFAAPEAFSVELLHVVEALEGDDGDELEEFYAKLEERARATLEHLATDLNEVGFEVSARIERGKRLREILRRAEEWDAELLIVVSHAVSEKGARVGTLSHQLAIFAPCPVLLVR